MRATFLVLTLCLFGWTSQAGPPDPEIERTIQQQLEAFQEDDFEAAFDHASPMIRSLFGSAERFGQMVESGYPMVHRWGAVAFLDLQEIDGRLWQMIEITDVDGGWHRLAYQMLEGPDGWKINAVEILKPTGLAV